MVRIIVTLGLIFIFGGALWPSQAHAEPWLGTRFTQNCVACHSAEKVAATSGSDKRCTYGCKGCHVSPQGGGLLDPHGKWNSERLLSSWRVEGWKLSKERPAAVGSVDGVTITEADKARVLQSLVGAVPDPQDVAQTSAIVGGGELRYFLYNQKTNAGSKLYSVPASADVGAQFKPVRRLSSVVEARFANTPTATNDRSQWDDLFTSGPIVKSAYVMVDDLPYNSWFIYGLQRPFFGEISPDRENLLNSLTYGSNQAIRAVYKATSLGTSWNVPYASVHLLSPVSSPAYSQDKGYVANVGARFLPFSSSFVLSYWDTTSDSANESRRRMLAVSGGAKAGRWIGHFDINKIQRDTPGGGYDSGSVYALAAKYQLWRENYLLLNYYVANTAADLTTGNSTQIEYGLKSFVLAGLEVEVLASDLRNKTVAGEANESRLQGQVHLFY